MIVSCQLVEQNIDRDERGTFVKELVVAQGSVPIAMVRKRAAELSGTHAPVLLIHGFGQNRYAWHLPSRSFSNYLARAGFDVFSLDLRGHGRSGQLSRGCAHGVSAHIQEDVPSAVEEIQRLSGDRPIFLVGHSLGGLISYAAAPELKGALGGVASFGSPYQIARGARALERLGNLLCLVDKTLHSDMVFVLPVELWGGVMRLGRAFVESPVFPLPFRGFARGSMERDVFEQHMSLAMDHDSFQLIASIFRTARERRERGIDAGGLEGYEDAFESLDLPLLVVAGEQDDLAPPASVKPGFERSHASDKTYRIVQAGHIDMLIGKNAPKTSWPLLEGWLNKRLEREVPAIRALPADVLFPPQPVSGLSPGPT